MLSEVEKQEILHEACSYEHKRAAVADALLIVRKSRKWVADESVADIAALLEMSVAEVDALATCYDLVYRRPVGRHVILLCDNVSCWLTGHEKIREHLSRALGVGLGQTTRDGRFTILPSSCLGACHMAPVMMIDEDLHGNLTPEKVDEILKTYQ